MSLLLLLSATSAGVVSQPTAASLTLTGATPAVAVSGVTVPVWTTPADTVSISATPSLAFTIPALGAPMHFNLQLDTADTFDTGDLRDLMTNMDQSGWEFWDGDSWESFPSGGVSASYAGNEARYTVAPDLTGTTWYRRVRAGV